MLQKYNGMLHMLHILQVFLEVLPLSLNVCRHDLRADNFDSIYRKYVQHFYLQINLLKN